jgi:hypothetical protein
MANRIVEDGNVDFVEVSIRCGKRYPTLKDQGQSSLSELSAFGDKPTCSCNPDEEATGFLDQTFDNLFSWPAIIQRTFLSDDVQIVFDEDVYVVVYN